MGTSVTNLITAAVTVLVLGGLVVLARRIEPHWVAADGRRFICRGQVLDLQGNPAGAWHEYRLAVTDHGTIEARRRSVLGARPAATWRVQARSPDPPRRRAVFLLADADDSERLLAIRMPESSRAVAVLDDLVGR